MVTVWQRIPEQKAAKPTSFFTVLGEYDTFINSQCGSQKICLVSNCGSSLSKSNLLGSKNSDWKHGYLAGGVDLLRSNCLVPSSGRLVPPKFRVCDLFPKKIGAQPVLGTYTHIYIYINICFRVPCCLSPPPWYGSKTYVLATFSWNPPKHMVFTMFWQARPPKPWYLQRFEILHCILLLL